MAENTADPRLFDMHALREPVGDWFVARLMFTTRSRRFFKTEIYHWRQLVVLVEFADGTRACRVVDVPEGLSNQPVTVDFD